MYTWTEVCTGVHSLHPDHCKPHRSPAGVVDGNRIRAENPEKNPGFLPGKGTCLSINERHKGSQVSQLIPESTSQNIYNLRFNAEIKAF